MEAGLGKQIDQFCRGCERVAGIVRTRQNERGHGQRLQLVAWGEIRKSRTAEQRRDHPFLQVRDMPQMEGCPSREGFHEELWEQGTLLEHVNQGHESLRLDHTRQVVVHIRLSGARLPRCGRDDQKKRVDTFWCCVGSTEGRGTAHGSTAGNEPCRANCVGHAKHIRAEVRALVIGGEITGL
jgi:hypothetical protein